MRLKGSLEYVEISTLGGQSKYCKRTRRVQFALSALDSREQIGTKQWRTMEALCLSKICSPVQANPLLQRRWKHLHGLKLADRFPRECSKIDVLISLDYYYDFVSQEVRHGHAREPVALRTLFGWIVCGSIGEGNRVRNVRSLHAQVMEDPNEILRKFWDLEAPGIRDAEEARKSQSTEAIRHYTETPFTIRAKIILQLLWQSGCGWDESIPDVLNAKWNRWKQELHMLPQLLVQRTLIPVDINAVASIELHAFADASGKAYGAVVYMKVETVSANNFVNMVIVKSRVAPLKKITLPRLELTAALVAARLVCYVKREIEMKVDRVACWSDSKVALSWIRSPSKSWKPFVQNRVQEIQALVDSANWYYCAGKDNPEDLLSRGTAIENLKSNSYWWHGPAWLKMPEGFWPKDDKMSELTDVHTQTVK
ncbi:hypothetical protein D918_10113 [Trichuris suis]|nr:hypothetical protein D918_10113 [Trichuris suis]